MCIRTPLCWYQLSFQHSMKKNRWSTQWNVYSTLSMAICIEGTHGNSLSVIITLPTKPLTLRLSWGAESERQISKVPNSGASISDGHWLLFIDVDYSSTSWITCWNDRWNRKRCVYWLRDNCRSLFIDREDCDQLLEVLMPVWVWSS